MDKSKLPACLDSFCPIVAGVMMMKWTKPSCNPERTDVQRHEPGLNPLG